MGDTSKIQFTHHTGSPWYGCQHAELQDGTPHPGCLHCYAELMSKRNPATLGEWGDDGRRVMSNGFWNNCRKWNRAAEKAGERRRVFPSMCDPFEDWKGPILDHHGRRIWKTPFEECPIELQGAGETDQQFFESGCEPLTMDDLGRDLSALIDSCPWLDFLLFTKRPGNVAWNWLKTPWNSCPKCNTRVDDLESNEREELFRLDENEDGWECVKCGHQASYFRPNAWLIYSASDQASLESGIVDLFRCRDLVPVLGISAEPLVGPIDVERYLISSDGFSCTDDEGPIHKDDGGIGLDWIIAGGESGPGARPCNVDWIRDIRDQCAAADVAFFGKQLGAFPYVTELPESMQFRPESYRLSDRDGRCRLVCKDKKGGDWNEWPDDLRVRQFPNLQTSKGE